MNLEHIEIARAELADVEGIVALAEKNAPERGGELSVHLEPADVAGVIRDSLIVVARQNGAVRGFVIAREKSRNAPAILRAMLQEYPGSPCSYSYGPVCVDESAARSWDGGDDVRRTTPASAGARGRAVHQGEQ